MSDDSTCVAFGKSKTFFFFFVVGKTEDRVQMQAWMTRANSVTQSQTIT